MNIITERLWLEDKKFIKKDELNLILSELGKEYSSTIRYLLSRGYLIRIFRGIFYIKSLEEIKLGKIEKTFSEIIAKGLELKGVKNWYFGLETALRLNNLTHEYFLIDNIINDVIFRPKPFTVMNHKVKFIKIKSELIFGIKEKGKIKFSDIEKTLLDFIYLSKYRSLGEREIYNKINELLGSCSKKKITEYSKKYPKSIKEFLIKWKIIKNL